MTDDAGSFDDTLLDLLACPSCRGDVFRKDGTIVCSRCGKRYPIRDGRPVMLVGEASDAASS